MKSSSFHLGACSLVASLFLLPSTTLADTLTAAQIAEGGVQLKVVFTMSEEKLPAPETLSVVSSDAAAIHAPSTITVSGGSTTFLITTGQVKSDTKVQLTIQKPVPGKPAEVKAAATLLVLAPPSVKSISVSPSNVIGGQSATGKITLGRPAAQGGVPVVLASSNGAVTFRSTPNIPEGASSATFGINTASVTQTTNVSISASSGGSTTSGTLSVRAAPVITSLTVPSPLTSGAAAQNGQIALAEAAADAITVTLQAAPASLQAPATVTVPAGAATASFSVAASGLPFGAADVPAQLTASIANSTKQASVTIKAPLPPSLISVTPVNSRQLIGTGNKILVLANDPMTVRVSGAGVARVSLLDHPGSFAEGTTVSPGLTTFAINFIHPGGGNVEAAVPGFATLFSESGATISSTQFGDLYYFDIRPAITSSSGKDIVIMPGDGNIEIPGQHMIIDGTGFAPKVGTVTPSGSLIPKVTIDGQQAQLISVSPTRIEVIVPNVSNCFGVKSLSVNNGAQPNVPGASPSAVNVSVPCPSIESITPTSVNSATTTGTSYIIRVRGNYLGKMNATISVNGVNGTVLPVSQNEVEVQLPRTITSGQVVVTTPWGTTAGSGGNTLSVF